MLEQPINFFKLDLGIAVFNCFVIAFNLCFVVWGHSSFRYVNLFVAVVLAVATVFLVYAGLRWRRDTQRLDAALAELDEIIGEQHAHRP